MLKFLGKLIKLSDAYFPKGMSCFLAKKIGVGGAKFSGIPVFL